jgi:hypothetical protein
LARRIHAGGEMPWPEYTSMAGRGDAQETPEGVYRMPGPMKPTRHADKR